MNWTPEQRLRAVVSDVAARYPVDVFPEPRPDSPADLFSAAGARLACRAILAELDKTDPASTNGPTCDDLLAWIGRPIPKAVKNSIPSAETMLDRMLREALEKTAEEVVEEVESLRLQVENGKREAARLRRLKEEADTKAQKAIDELAENFKPYGVAASFAFVKDRKDFNVYGSAAAISAVAGMANELEKARVFGRAYNPAEVVRIVANPGEGDEFLVLRGLPEAFQSLEAELAEKERERVLAVADALGKQASSSRAPWVFVADLAALARKS